MPPLQTHELASFPSLQNYVGRLQSLGIGTLESLTGAAQVARPELEAFLGTSIDGLLDQIPVAAAAIPQQALNTIQNADYPLGVAIDQIPHLEIAPALLSSAGAAPPASVDLVSQMPTIRNQAQRGTCVAFAALAAYEHALGTSGAMQDLSEQFLYWNCKRSDGSSSQEGTWLGVAFPLLQRDGCCPEGIWPYVPTPIAGNEGQAPPPGGAQLQALTFRMSGFQQLSATSVADIKARLAAGRCVSFSIPVFNSWYRSPNVAYSGDITNPIPGEVRVGGHAMCLVGYIDSPQDTAIGGGRFILRNSWDTTWGLASPHGAGYGTIPYSYIARLATEAFSPN
jgi:C1A family cysteine protease